MPGNALDAPALIGRRCRASCGRPRRRIMREQFIAAIRAEMKVKRNDSAIEALQGAAG